MCPYLGANRSSLSLSLSLSLSHTHTHTLKISIDWNEILKNESWDAINTIPRHAGTLRDPKKKKNLKLDSSIGKKKIDLAFLLTLKKIGKTPHTSLYCWVDSM